MFNRANKATALLVAAAAVVSLVPATGVNAAEVERIKSEDGKVYHAVAYKDGHFYIDGEVNNKDEAAYYLADAQYNGLENIDTNSSIKTYGEKYVEVENGDYFVDLTNGKVADENLREDSLDDTASSLRRKLKDDTEDRYDATDVNNVRTESTLKVVPGNKFAENWYETEVTRAQNCTSNGTRDFFVYSDAKGNYIDADHNLGSIKVKVQETGATTTSSVTIENTDKKYKVGKTGEVKANINHIATLTQDSKYIYRYATLDITVNNANIKEVNGKDATSMTITSIPVIQKISKEQASDDVNGAKYAKSVYTYVVSQDDANLTGKTQDFKTLLDATTTSVTSVTVVNGKLVAYQKLTDTNGDEKVIAQAASLKTKAGWYYTDCEAQSKEDVEYNDDHSQYAVDVDADGNLWRVEGGHVFKFDNNDEWDKVYKVDGSMDRLSVYNKDNMVVWNDADEVYSVIGNKEATEETKPEIKAGWNKNTDGTWTFVKADGTKATGWLQDGANWYFLNAAGIMQTGWVNDNGTWYFTNASGAMTTGWQNVNGTWYFLAGNGAMQTGWINDNGTWYFTDASGKMLANTTVNGYVLGANGAWVK